MDFHEERRKTCRSAATARHAPPAAGRRRRRIGPLHIEDSLEREDLRALGAVGVIRIAGSVQVILGTTAELVEAEMKLLLKTTEK